MIDQASLRILVATIPVLCSAAGCKGTGWPGYQSFGKTPTFVVSGAELASADLALKTAAPASPSRQSSKLSSGSSTRTLGSSEPGCSSGCCGGS